MAEQTAVPQPRRILSASTITGDKVVNLQNEDLGKIEELMIDLGSGDGGENPEFAYRLYEEHGRQDGRAKTDRFEAEEIIRSKSKRTHL